MLIGFQNIYCQFSCTTTAQSNITTATITPSIEPVKRKVVSLERTNWNRKAWATIATTAMARWYCCSATFERFARIKNVYPNNRGAIWSCVLWFHAPYKSQQPTHSKPRHPPWHPLPRFLPQCVLITGSLEVDLPKSEWSFMIYDPAQPMGRSKCHIAIPTLSLATQKAPFCRTCSQFVKRRAWKCPLLNP